MVCLVPNKKLAESEMRVMLAFLPMALCMCNQAPPAAIGS